MNMAAEELAGQIGQTFGTACRGSEVWLVPRSVSQEDQVDARNRSGVLGRIWMP